MYHVLLVDDERPALRFLQMLLERHARDYAVVCSCLCAEDALAYLSQHPVDLLITDISMMDMDGIQLAGRARAIHSGIHIVIVTGYADFHYAQGAIQAAVDDYLLKPVSIPHMTRVLDQIREKLDAEYAARELAMLAALFSGRTYDQQLAARLYRGDTFYFALVRWGNLGLASGPLLAPAPLPLRDAPFHALYGRDEHEQLIFMPAHDQPEVFTAAVEAYAAQHRSAATLTILVTRSGSRFTSLPTFFRRAAAMMEQSVVIGLHQTIAFTGSAARDTSRQLSSAQLKRLEHFVMENSMQTVRDIFISLAADWERVRLPQCCASHMVMQLTCMALALRFQESDRQESLLTEVRELLWNADSYGDLMASLYATLYDDHMTRDRKLSTEELCRYALHYIQEKYAQPISIQNVCAELGISQTYLSRLLRKHAHTSFSAYLTQQRMERAQEMIRTHPETALRDVAACVGYDDYAYFSRIFRQAAGCTPSQWATEARRQTSDASMPAERS